MVLWNCGFEFLVSFLVAFYLFFCSSRLLEDQLVWGSRAQVHLVINIKIETC